MESRPFRRHQILAAVVALLAMFNNFAMGVPQPIAILTQPAGGAYVVGDTVTLSVTAEGSPVFYQWQKDGQNIGGARSPTYSFVAAAESQSGAYTVIVSNSANSVVSAPANVLVLPDRSGPILETAVLLEAGATNRIDVTFSENPVTGSVTPASFRVIRISDGQEVTVSNPLTSARVVRIQVGGTAWRLSDEYIVVVNNVKDAKGNIIAPGSRVPLQRKVRTTIFGLTQDWMFHSAAIFDPDVYDQPWTGLGYIPGPWWATGPGHFYHLRCTDSMATDVGYQPEPILFRASFHWPAAAPATADLQLSIAIDDGAIFYLNGLEIFRTNAPAGRPTSSSRALNSSNPFFGCLPNTTDTVHVTNLVAGPNVVAVAVLQESLVASSDTLFALRLDSFHLQGPTLPDEPAPRLDITQVSSNMVRLGWTGGGFVLESATEISNSLSYPVGPWQPVMNMANPMLYPLDSQSRFFRLKTPR